MATTAKIHQTKAIGWYAVQRVRIADWLKPRHAKQDNQTRSDSPQADNSAETAGASVSDQASRTSDQASEKQQHDQAKSHTSTNTSEEKEAKQSTKDDKSDSSSAFAKPTSDGKEAQKLHAVVRESHTILAKASSVFPFQLFPDAINIDRHKLTIIRRQFFGIEQKVSVPLENVKNIEADLGPFFGSLTITSDLFINNTQEVHFLPRNDTKKIQKLVQGAVVAQGEGIDLNKIEVKKLRGLLMDLGSGHTKSI